MRGSFEYSRMIGWRWSGRGYTLALFSMKKKINQSKSVSKQPQHRGPFPNVDFLFFYIMSSCNITHLYNLFVICRSALVFVYFHLSQCDFSNAIALDFKRTRFVYFGPQVTVLNAAGSSR